jgi:hypothetical protein
MEPTTKEMRETAVYLERIADTHIKARQAHRFVDVQTRETAITLLTRFEQGFPSNQAFKSYSVGPRFTWRMLKSFARKVFNAISNLRKSTPPKKTAWQKPSATG